MSPCCVPNRAKSRPHFGLFFPFIYSQVSVIEDPDYLDYQNVIKTKQNTVSYKITFIKFKD